MRSHYRFLHVGLMGSILLTLMGCGNRVMETPDGIPHKVVIRTNDTQLYTSSKLTEQSDKTGHQWEFFFVFNIKGDSYKVSSQTDGGTAKFYWVKEEDIFEWNNPFCLSFKDSPHTSNRQPVSIYKSLAGLKANKENDIHLVEKEIHATSLDASSCQPILKEEEDDIYFIATLYDDFIDGEYVFLGHYDFGYVRYSSSDYRYYRYVSRTELGEQIRKLTGTSTLLVDAPPNSSIIDEIFKNMSSLLGELDGFVDGVKDLEKILGGENVPDGIEGEIFSRGFREGKKIDKLNPQLLKIISEMTSYHNDDFQWNQNNYALIPVEWVENMP